MEKKEYIEFEMNNSDKFNDLNYLSKTDLKT